MQSDIKKIIIFKRGDLLPKMGRLWKRAHSLIFFVCLIVAIVIGFKIWQQALYGSGWSEQQKQDYLKSHSKSVEFQEKEFEKVLIDVQTRKTQNENFSPLRNLFEAYN